MNDKRSSNTNPLLASSNSFSLMDSFGPQPAILVPPAEPSPPELFLLPSSTSESVETTVSPFLNPVDDPPPPPPPSIMNPSVSSTFQAPPTLNVTPLSDAFEENCPLCYHWFYRSHKLANSEDEYYWKPFDMNDSTRIESEYLATQDGIVPVMGTRYDVSIRDRLMTCVYWDSEEQIPIRRCSWFYQAPSSASYWIPYDEETASFFEQRYQESVRDNSWNKKVKLNDNGYIMMHSKSVIMHFPHKGVSGLLDNWGQVQTQEPTNNPRMVHRGLEGLPDIPDGDNPVVDHLVFVVHGIGSFCDIKFRTLPEVVSTFREVASYLSEKHFQAAHLSGTANRIEFLPVSWHRTLHGEDTGTDARLQPLTLKSIPKLRSFMNETLMDILFYTSPVFGQKIVDTVVKELNQTYALFKKRNPNFNGKVSIVGHSLGSVILFDILSHQTVTLEKEVTPTQNNKNEAEPTAEETLESLFKKLDISDYLSTFTSEGIEDIQSLMTFTENELRDAGLSEDAVTKLCEFIQRRNGGNKRHAFVPATTSMEEFNRNSVKSDVKYVVGPAGTGQLSVNYPQLDFHVSGFYALGSPIALFMAVRGISTIGDSFSFPTCSRFFNIFHPYDPVAYRIEAMINAEYAVLRPLTVPHHMGRKRMHLELKDTVTRLMTSDIRKKILEGVSYTLSSVYNLATGSGGNVVNENELNQTMEDEMNKREDEDHDNPKTLSAKLNGGKRIDYVLQEAPLESFNQYLFAIASHTCYWDSEDTCLMILKAIYSELNVKCDEELQVKTKGNSARGSVVDVQPSSSHFPPAPPPLRPSPTESAPPLGPSLIPSGSAPPLGPSFIPPVSAPPLTPSNIVPPLGPSSNSGPVPPLGPPLLPSGISVPSGPPVMPSGFASPINPSGPPPTSLPSIPSLGPSSMPSGSLSVPPPSSTKVPSKLKGYPKVFPGVSGLSQHQGGMDPTAPLAQGSGPIGPPPIGGFIRK